MAFSIARLFRRKPAPQAPLPVPSGVAGTEEEWNKFFSGVEDGGKVLPPLIRPRSDSSHPREPMSLRNLIALGLVAASCTAIWAAIRSQTPVTVGAQSIVQPPIVRVEAPPIAAPSPAPDKHAGQVWVEAHDRKNKNGTTSHVKGHWRNK